MAAELVGLTPDQEDLLADWCWEVVSTFKPNVLFLKAWITKEELLDDIKACETRGNSRLWDVLARFPVVTKEDWLSLRVEDIKRECGQSTGSYLLVLDHIIRVFGLYTGSRTASSVNRPLWNRLRQYNEELDGSAWARLVRQAIIQEGYRFAAVVSAFEYYPDLD